MGSLVGMGGGGGEAGRVLGFIFLRPISVDQRSVPVQIACMTSKMESDWSYNGERQRGTLRHSLGMEAGREKTTGSTQNNMEEDG